VVTSPLVLASTSPQRKLILAQLDIPFIQVAPSYREVNEPDADPIELVRRHAEGKATSVHRDGDVTIGVDTAVQIDDLVLGKPRTADDARAMLRTLAGRTHVVISALCLLGTGDPVVGHERTAVTFRPIRDAEIERYILAREWSGRAGAYAIQGLGARFVTRIDGDYLNVVGLPAALLVSILGRHRPALLGLSA
jgi:septum formation protein